MAKKKPETDELRQCLSMNVKKQRKIMGFTQEKLAEAANLSFQTINDIEGCRMWVSDKTIVKLAKALHIEVYQLLMPIIKKDEKSLENVNQNEFLLELEGRIIRTIKREFEEANQKDTIIEATNKEENI